MTRIHFQRGTHSCFFSAVKSVSWLPHLSGLSPSEEFPESYMAIPFLSKACLLFFSFSSNNCREREKKMPFNHSPRRSSQLIQHMSFKQVKFIGSSFCFFLKKNYLFASPCNTKWQKTWLTNLFKDAYIYLKDSYTEKHTKRCSIH